MTEVGIGTDQEVEIEGESPEDIEIENDTSQAEEVPVRYNIASYGWDSDVEGLVKRLNREDIVVPKFQRKYVWNRAEKSRFIESLILGLPIPSIFLSTDPTTKKMNIIDGQQRLLTLQEYLNCKFALSAKDLQPELKGLYYEQPEGGPRRNVLDDNDRRTLQDALVHAIVIKQDIADSSDDARKEFSDAIIQIFKRLNTSGKPLMAQEVRACVYHGPLNDLLGTLNQNQNWRILFGTQHSRLRDVEAILRFIALFKDSADYRPSMKLFLDRFMRDNRTMEAETCNEISELFETACSLIVEAKGASAFKTGGTFLLSRFDAVMNGIAHQLHNRRALTAAEIGVVFDALLEREDYKWATSEFVNDTDRMETRLTAARDVFT